MHDVYRHHCLFIQFLFGHECIVPFCRTAELAQNLGGSRTGDLVGDMGPGEPQADGGK